MAELDSFFLRFFFVIRQKDMYFWIYCYVSNKCWC